MIKHLFSSNWVDDLENWSSSTGAAVWCVSGVAASDQLNYVMMEPLLVLVFEGNYTCAYSFIPLNARGIISTLRRSVVIAVCLA